MRLAAYCRVSTEKEEQMDSLVHQKEFFEEYAKKNRHELFSLYADEGISGTSLEKRAQFKRMMCDAEAGKFEILVVKDVSRMARNTVDFLQSIRKLKSMGINVLFINSNMDSLGESEFVLTIFGAMAQEESENLSKRVKWGKKINAQKGRVPQRIYGYDRIDNFTLQINSVEAEVVRQIFKLYIEEGLGCRVISQQLNAQHVKTKLGHAWEPKAIRRILTNSIYCGKYVNHKYEIADVFSRRQVQVPEEQQFHHDRPQWAIIPCETFEQAQNILQSRRTKYNSAQPLGGARYSAKHIFSTLIQCEHCGRSFCRKSYTHVNTRNYWKCSTNDQFTAQTCDNRIKLEEPELLAELGNYFSSLIADREAFIADVLFCVEKKIADREKSAFPRENLERQIEKCLAKKERYQEMYANDLLTMSELKSKTDAVLEELKTLYRKQEECAQRMRNDFSMDVIRSLYAQEVLRFLNLETMTNVELRQIVERIYVNQNGNVKIVLKHLDDRAK